MNIKILFVIGLFFMQYDSVFTAQNNPEELLSKPLNQVASNDDFEDFVDAIESFSFDINDDEKQPTADDIEFSYNAIKALILPWKLQEEPLFHVSMILNQNVTLYNALWKRSQHEDDRHARNIVQVALVLVTNRDPLFLAKIRRYAENKQKELLAARSGK